MATRKPEFRRVTKNLASDLQGLSGGELRQYLEDKIDELEEELINLPTKYPDKYRPTRYDKPY